MKIRNKLIALLTAITLTSAFLPTVYADTVSSPTEGSETPSETPDTSDPTPDDWETPGPFIPPTTEDNSPYLGSNVFSGEYSCTLNTIRKGDVFNITVNTYIPIENYSGFLGSGYFSDCNIFAVPTANQDFRFVSQNQDSCTTQIVGSFLRVTNNFQQVECLGNGNSLSYTICYKSKDQSLNVPISLSIAEYQSAAEEPHAIFALSGNSVHKIQAGSRDSVYIGLNRINQGTFSSVTASLSSSDSSIIVEDTGSQTSSSATPQFGFLVFVPLSTPAGSYSLTLHTTVLDKKGSAVSQESYTIPLTVTSDVVPSGLEILSYEFTKEPLKPDTHFSLSLLLANNCNIDLKNVTVSLADLDTNKFAIDYGFASQTINIPKDGTKNVKFHLIAGSGITSVREAVPVHMEYRLNPTDAASLQTIKTSIIAECAPTGGNPEGKYAITMTDYTIDRNVVASGVNFTLKFTLQNTSSNYIQGARVSLPGLDGTKFALDHGLTYADFNLKAQNSRRFSFPLVGCGGISSIREMIPIEINFGQQSQTVYATIPCTPSKDNTEGKDSVFAPPIIIENYQFGGDYVLGGNTFPLALTIKNAGSAAAIENLKVTISGGAGNGNNGVAFSPANSSNSFFIESLRPKNTTQISLDLLPRADATPDSYPVIVTFDYEYVVNGSRAKAETVTETITIPLQQEDRLTINQPDFPETCGLGEMAYISVSLINKGKSDVYNVTADFEGEGFDKSSGAYYIGNITSGSEEYYDVQITPFEEGEVHGELVITYEDSNGTQREQRTPVTINVVSYNWGGDIVVDDPGYWENMEPEEPGGSRKWLWFAVGGGIAALVVIILVIVIVKKRKKKRELEIEDEDI